MRAAKNIALIIWWFIVLYLVWIILWPILVWLWPIKLLVALALVVIAGEFIGD